MSKDEANTVEDDDHERFLAAVGRTVLAWQGVEEALVAVFVAVVQPKEGWPERAAQAALLALMANAKAEAVDAAIHQGLKFFPELLKRGDSLLERFKVKAQDRNRIAHGVWVGEWTDFDVVERPDGSADVIGLKFENKIAAHPMRRRRGKAQPPTFDIGRLEQSLIAFKRLEYDLSVFARDVAERGDPPKGAADLSPPP